MLKMLETAGFPPLPTQATTAATSSTDRGLERRVAARLKKSSYHSLRRIGCDVHDGVVVLRGQVPSYYLKQVAQALLLDMPEVEVLVNQVEVVPPRRQAR